MKPYAGNFIITVAMLSFDGTLPRPQLDQELKGRHRVERVLNVEVSYVRYLDRLDREHVRLHQLRY